VSASKLRIGGKYMKKAYTLGFVLMVLFSMTMSAAALDSKTIFRQNGNAADASWSSPDGSTFTGLSVSKTDDGTDVFVFISTPTTFKFGFIFTQEDVFDINNKLTTATLSPVKVDLFDLSTGTVETITIQAQWTGFGDLTKSSSKFTSKSGEFVEKFSDSSTIRAATATGSINGQDLGTSDFADLINFKSASITMEK
jgi:hypothetical protein